MEGLPRLGGIFVSKSGGSGGVDGRLLLGIFVSDSGGSGSGGVEGLPLLISSLASGSSGGRGGVEGLPLLDSLASGSGGRGGELGCPRLGGGGPGGNSGGVGCPLLGGSHSSSGEYSSGGGSGFLCPQVGLGLREDSRNDADLREDRLSGDGVRDGCGGDGGRRRLL